MKIKLFVKDYLSKLKLILDDIDPAVISEIIEALEETTDLVIAISCSGDSPNILKAVNYAQKLGCKIIGATGFQGGHLKKISDISFHVNALKNEYGLVEDTHMILDHIIYSYYVQKSTK